MGAWYACTRCVRITEAARMIMRLNEPLLLLGPPGVGKTSVARKAARRYAKEKGLKMIDLTATRVEVDGCKGDLADPSVQRCLVELVERRPEEYLVYYRMVMSHVLPEDVLGLPRDAGRGLMYYSKPLPIRLMSVDGVEGLLLLDEVTSIARDDVRSLLYAMLDERRVGDATLSGRVRIVACGNRVSDDPDHIEPLPKPLVNRMVVVEVAPPLVEEWAEYMDSVHGEWWRTAYHLLLLHPSLLHSQPRDRDSPVVSPRLWEKIASEVARLCNWRVFEDRLCYRLVETNLGASVAARLRRLYRALSDTSVAEELEDASIAETSVAEKLGTGFEKIVADRLAYELVARRMISPLEAAELVKRLGSRLGKDYVARILREVALYSCRAARLVFRALVNTDRGYEDVGKALPTYCRQGA